jgi:hydrogenase maturation factor HypF (carbamoyltransferase family)
MSAAAENLKVRVRCPECRTTFRERAQRVVHSDRIVCPRCHHEMRFHGIDHHRPNEDIAHFIRHVEARTCHPRLMRSE